MAEFKIKRGSQANYDAIEMKDIDTVYVCVDSGRCYLGDKMLSPKVAQIYTSGMKVYYNGVDVTESQNLETIVNAAIADWYGSSGSYDELISTSAVQAGVLYHIEVQSDWSESDPKKLSHVKNQPNVLDMEHVDETHSLKFFYTKYNQVVPYTNQQQNQE